MPDTINLHGDEEEDLVDYGDSDVESGPIDYRRTTIEDIDIFADETMQTEHAAQSDNPGGSTDKSVGEEASTTINKTPEAATVIKTLNDQLTSPAFRGALGLVEPGATLALNFWADGLDFAVSLQLIGAADIKPCKYGAECRHKKCTFDHGGSDRSAVLYIKKPRKLCSMINTPTGCIKGDACWFSHEALGVVCADGQLRAACMKGVYCVYRHADDGISSSVEYVEQHGDQRDDEGAKGSKLLAVDFAPETRTNIVPVPALNAQAPPIRGDKRHRLSEDQAGSRPTKAHRIYCPEVAPERPGTQDPCQECQDSDPGCHRERRGRDRKGGLGIRCERGGKCVVSERSRMQHRGDKRKDRKKLSDRVTFE